MDLATRPERLELQREADSLRLRGRVPSDLLFFEGHFPGHPVLPGFVQLHWVMQLAEEALGIREPPAALEALKFRVLLLPGADFLLRVDRSATGLRFAYESGGQVCASGRVRFDSPVAAHPAEIAPVAEVDGSLLRIPQTGRMRLLDRVVAHAGRVTLCEASIHEATPLCSGGRVPSWLALELLAQGMAAQGGVASAPLASGRRAFLVGARHVELRTRGFAPGDRLWVRAEHLRGETGFVLCDCSLGTGAPPASGDEARKRALARGPLQAYVEPPGGESATR